MFLRVPGRLAVRLLDAIDKAPLWLRAGAWISKAAQGLANAGVWAAPFLRAPHRTPRRCLNEARLLGEDGDATTTTLRM